MDYMEKATANTSAKQRVAATLRKVLLVSPHLCCNLTSPPQALQNRSCRSFACVNIQDMLTRSNLT